VGASLQWEPLFSGSQSSVGQVFSGCQSSVGASFQWVLLFSGWVRVFSGSLSLVGVVFSGCEFSVGANFQPTEDSHLPKTGSHGRLAPKDSRPLKTGTVGPTKQSHPLKTRIRQNIKINSKEQVMLSFALIALLYCIAFLKRFIANKTYDQRGYLLFCSPPHFLWLLECSLFDSLRYR
jgi:hypothetical protein